MARLDDVEFFADDDIAVTSDDDAVEIGTRRIPRWANAVGGALVAAIFIGIVATSPHPKERAEQSAPVVVSTADPDVTGRVGPVLHLDGPTDARAMVVHRDHLFVLRKGGVSVIALASNRATWMPLIGRYSLPANGSTRLLFDADADRLWVVAMGARTAQLVEFNASRMVAVRRVDVDLAVLDAAAMRGHVYLGTSTGLADLAPGAAGAVILRGTRGVMRAVAADPARDRVLAIDASPPYADIVVVSSNGTAVRRSFGGNLIKASIAVVGDAIWVGGYGGDSLGGRHAIVARLNPTTLVPVATSAVALTVARVIVSGGTNDIWISTDGAGLWCIDPTTGEVLQHWLTATGPVVSEAAHGPVQSRAGSAYAFEAGRLVTLVLTGCTG